jgi:hypothetical protein
MVSVIIPNYNHARFLKERIDLKIEQTFLGFEITISGKNSAYKFINYNAVIKQLKISLILLIIYFLKYVFILIGIKWALIVFLKRNMANN